MGPLSHLCSRVIWDRGQLLGPEKKPVMSVRNSCMALEFFELEKLCYERLHKVVACVDGSMLARFFWDTALAGRSCHVFRLLLRLSSWRWP